MDQVTEHLIANYRPGPKRARRWPPRWLRLDLLVGVGAFLLVAAATAAYSYPLMAEVLGGSIAVAVSAIFGAAFGYVVLMLFRVWRKMSADDGRVTTRRGME